MILCEPGQAWKGAAAADDSCAGMWLEARHPNSFFVFFFLCLLSRYLVLIDSASHSRLQRLEARDAQVSPQTLGELFRQLFGVVCLQTDFSIFSQSWYRRGNRRGESLS